VEDVLGVAVGPDAGHRQAGGLRLGADDGKVLADERVEKGRLADIRGAARAMWPVLGGMEGRCYGL